LPGSTRPRRSSARCHGGPEVEITIVNCDNFILFTPMLHEVAASDLDSPTSHPDPPDGAARGALRRHKEEIDLPGRRVLVRHTEGHAHELEYDHLVLALGSVQFLRPPRAGGTRHDEVARRCHRARNRLIEVLEEADFESRPDRHQLLTVLVAGGGLSRPSPR
jgi:NADH dehydrogenase